MAFGFYRLSISKDVLNFSFAKELPVRYQHDKLFAFGHQKEMVSIFRTCNLSKRKTSFGNFHNCKKFISKY